MRPKNRQYLGYEMFIQFHMSKHVNNMFIQFPFKRSNTPRLIQSLINHPHSKFALKQFKDLDNFLGIEAKHFSDGSLLQTKFKYTREG